MLMNADKIILPDFLIADLYKDSLVDVNDLSEKSQQFRGKLASTENSLEASSSAAINYYGENRKNITVVINQPGNIDLNKDDFSFLSNILKACQLNVADIAIVNTGVQKVTYAEIKKQLNAKQIILFGTEPSVVGLPFKIPLFQVQNYDNCTIIPAPAFSAINQQTQEGKLLKTKLWNSLKQVFNVG